ASPSGRAVLLPLRRIRLPPRCERLGLDDLRRGQPPGDDVTVLGGIAIAMGRRQIEPEIGLYKVLWHALAHGIGDPELELSRGEALVGGFAIPRRRLGLVLGNAFAVVEEDSEIVLGRGVALFGGSPEPHRRLAKVLRHAQSALV